MENCIFCNIAKGAVPAEKVYEDDTVVAFLDIHPKAPGHTLLISKDHYQWFEELPDDLSDHLFRVAKTLAKEMKRKDGIDYVHLSIVGKDVPHVHMHLIPRSLPEQVEP
jgi:histidine triad (HIT) family protein